MQRRSSIFALAAVGASFAAVSGAQAQTTAAPITLVIELTATRSKPRAEAVAAMKRVVEVIARQPGLVDEMLMENKNPDNKPSHVHVMRWRSLQNWEAVHTNPEFQKVLQANATYFTLSAGIYTPVK